MRSLFRPAYIGLIALAPRGQRLREALEHLGPIFVKFGQVLSTRRDLLPPDIADELALLQDNVPPFSGRAIATMVERAFRKPSGGGVRAASTRAGGQRLHCPGALRACVTARAGARSGGQGAAARHAATSSKKT
jgi:hypothetical protein